MRHPPSKMFIKIQSNKVSKNNKIQSNKASKNNKIQSNKTSRNNKTLRSSLRRKPKYHPISWSGNFVEMRSFVECFEKVFAHLNILIFAIDLLTVCKIVI